jgi:hypothetical protein
MIHQFIMFLDPFHNSLSQIDCITYHKLIDFSDDGFKVSQWVKRLYLIRMTQAQNRVIQRKKRVLV